MALKKEFRAEILGAEKGGAFVKIPFDVEKVFGKKRVPIKATFNGVKYRGTLVRMGSPEHILIIRKDIRAQIDKQPGDQIEVTIEEDTAPRVVTIPEDLQKLLTENPAAKANFEKQSYTHQKEYVNWIEEAKRQETRARRLAKAIQMLKDGKKGI
ncbi:MAG: DUF1905 domain-containing protein [Calditrichaeota bacterium]|nr:MAG: DUF1905 domain-containing protein [Calditrichota bacterium]